MIPISIKLYFFIIISVILTFSMVLFLFDGHYKNFNFEENQEIQQDKSHPEGKIILEEEVRKKLSMELVLWIVKV